MGGELIFQLVCIELVLLSRVYDTLFMFTFNKRKKKNTELRWTRRHKHQGLGLIPLINHIVRS